MISTQRLPDGSRTKHGPSGDSDGGHRAGQVIIVPRGIAGRLAAYPGDHPWASMLFLCCLGLGLRLWNLAGESLWLDEATSLIIARLPLGELSGYMLRDDVHPPLYFLLLHFWRMGGEGAAYLRLFSVITGVLSLPAIYLVGRQLFDSASGVLAAALLAIAPLAVCYSQMVRNYSLYLLLTVWSLYMLLKAVETNALRWWSAYLLNALAALGAHYFAAPALAFQSTLVLLLILKKPGPWPVVKRWFVINAILGIAFLAWLGNSAVLLEGTSPGWLSAEPPPSLTALTSLLTVFSFGHTASFYPRGLRLASYALMAALLILATFGQNPRAALARIRHHAGLQFTWAYLLLPLGCLWLVSQFRPVFVERYLIPYMIPLLLLLAVGITAAQAAWRPWLAATLCLVVFVPGLWLSTQLLEQDDWRIATTYVLARAQPDDIVVFSPPWYVKPFEYYARGQIAYYAAEDEFDVQAVCGAAPVGHKRVWLIQPYESHWTDPNNRLNACLDSSLGRGEEFRFPPHNGRIVLYQVSASSQVIP